MFFLQGREELTDGTKHFLCEVSCLVTLEYAGTCSGLLVCVTVATSPRKTSPCLFHLSPVLPVGIELS